MVGRKKWARRRDDNREETKPKYNLIQSVETQDDELRFETSAINDQSIGIPEFSGNETDLKGGHSKAAPRIFALIGATGGVGTTCLATQLAHEFAIRTAPQNISKRHSTDPTVCLIDLDFESGACAHHLDLVPSLNLEDLCGPADHIDRAFTQALVSTHECGISLLAAPSFSDESAQINPQTVLTMLDAAAELYDIVIIDLPRYRQPWTRAVMRAVDVLLLTCELTIPSLQAARERFSKIPEDANTSIIVGKYERRSFKSKLRLSDAEVALGQSVLNTLCLDPDTTREALNCGEPAGVIRPESRFVKDVRKLADSLQQKNTRSLDKVA